MTSDSIGRWSVPSLARATVIVVVAGLFWRTVRYALAFPLWGDEAFVAVNFLTRDLAGLARPLDYFQIAPPGFLWLEWLTAHWLGTGERALRLLPYVAGVASLLLFWRFCLEVATRRTALVAIAMMAASFFPVRHCTEVKPYAIDLLISLAVTMSGWAVGRDVQSRRSWLALTAVTTIGVWCSYTTVFPAGSVVLFLAARLIHERSIRPRVLFVAFGLVTTLSWGIMFAGFAMDQARAADFLSTLETWKDAFPPLGEPWRLPWWLIKVHTGHMLAYPYGGNNFGSTLSTVLVVTGSVRMGRRRARRPLLFLLLGPLPFAMVAAALHRYPYGTSARVMLYMAPAFCLLIAEGIMAFLQVAKRARDGPMIVAGVLALVTLVCTGFNVVMPYKAYDDVLHRSIARWLADRTAPGDQWIVFNGASPPPPLKDLMVMPWLQRVGEAHFYLLRSAPVPVRWEPVPETVRPDVDRTIWLIVQNHGDREYFPANRLAAYERDIEARLGKPLTTTRFTLPRGESWCIREFRSVRSGGH